MNKKGISHVGFAIAFVLFIGFILFMINILSPLQKVKNDKNFILKQIEKEIIKNSSSELIIASIKGGSDPCLDISGLELKNQIIAKDQNGQIIKSSSSSVENSGFVKIYSVDKGFNPQIPCTGNPGQISELGLIRKENYFFEDSVLELIQIYNSDYKGLKKSLNIPENNDFEFGFIYSNETEIKTISQDNPETDVFAEKTPVKYISKDADIEIGYLRVAVW